MAQSRLEGDRGASLVEFALVLPIFFTLLLGMFTGGLAYSRKLSITQGAREGARYGATLPVAALGTTDLWLQRVATVTVESSDGELAPANTGASVCVAYVPGTGTPRKYEKVGLAATLSNGTCFDDGRTGETRVQVVSHRTSRLEALLWSRDLDLSSNAVARFEAG